MKNHREPKLPAIQLVKLKPGTFPPVKVREWIVEEYIPNGKILLRCPDYRNYTLSVIPEHIEMDLIK